MAKKRAVVSTNSQKTWPILLFLWVLLQIGRKTSLILTLGLQLLHMFWQLIKLITRRSLFTLGYIIGRIEKAFTIKQTTTQFPGFGVLYQHSAKRKRGRPRTQPWLRFYWHKFAHRYIHPVTQLIGRLIPRSLRWGLGITFMLIFIFGYSFFLLVIANDLPNPNRLKQPLTPITTEIYDRHNKLLYRIYEGRNRTLINLDQVPTQLLQATIAIEDQNFYEHLGIDISGIVRAFVSNLQHKEMQGGSTITQQLIKNTLLSSDRTWQRKIREVILSFWTEQIYSKDQILTMYLNEAPYGGPAWGIEAAAQTYFDKPTKDLTLAESSYLAGLTASPTLYSPYGPHPELAKQRQAQVLRRMIEDHYITEEEAQKAAKEELAIKPPKQDILAPHFVMYVRSLLEDKYGPRVVSQGGLKVITSLDLNVQQEAEKIVAEEVEKLKSLRVGNGAAMITDPTNGQILAMVGSKNYFDPKNGNFNVTIANRQPGSSIKPITYAAGFKLGYAPGTILLDVPTVFKNPWETYAPVNYDGRFHGPVSIRTALGSSYNIPAVKMLHLIGLPAMLDTAKDLGITTLTDVNKYGLSLTLGAGEVKMIDMMTAYGTFSQMGIRHDPNPILMVVDSQGITLEDNTHNLGKKVLNPGIAYMITDILSDNKARTPAFGPNSQLVIPNHTVAAKTGTTDNKKDNWAFGYTADRSVGVWVGNNDNTPMDPQLTSGITGATPIWNRLMNMLLKDKPNIAFQRPDEVTVADNKNNGDGKNNSSSDLVLKGMTPKNVVTTNVQKSNDPAGKDQISFTDPFTTYIPDQPSQPSN